MTEKERLDIIKRIEGKIKNSKLLEEKNKELERLLQEESVRKYLKLQEEIEKIKKEQRYFSTNEENIVEIEFDYGTRKLSSCNHDIWLYEGSYSIEQNNLQGIDCRKVKHNTEQCYNFEHNKYICLECGKIIEEHNWEEFESTHFVLKASNIQNISKYRKLYRSLLFNNQVVESQNLLIEEFYKDTGKVNACLCKKRKNLSI